MILFSLTRWMEMVLYLQTFHAISNFAHKLNSQLWMEIDIFRQIGGNK